ncbi:putative basic amino acid antiporter YfcC [Clostridium sp. CS001]|uniref:putative basic amino acid antiporter YfcC n=1 Tax=Clostridium sp. CS001 TaxID=2880648 RepID=UPI001CF4EA93|nr:putative basic amino acid antiporter YfcC [Clostridium sp. CS001]MCB2289384.1 putative basic amino acid antiporter YfcC [Clostridium sp. CS001]
MVQNKKKKWSFEMPDTYVIIFFVVLLAALVTYIMPLGRFEVNYKAYNANEKKIVEVADGQKASFQVNSKNYIIDATGEKTLLLEEGKEEPLGEIKKSKAKALEVKEDTKLSFKVVQEYGKFVSSGERKGIKLFASGGDVGFLNYVFEGIVKGDKWGSAVGVIAFILVVGGAFGIILKTGAVESGILSMISKSKGREVILIPVLFILFSLGGAVFGMGEESIPFAMIIVPLVIAMGYDAIVGIMITYCATQIGFATSWMNPFSVAIAQGIAGIPILSGAGFRIFLWVGFTAVGILYTWFYAKKIRKNPLLSVAYESDEFYRKDFKEKDIKEIKFTIGHKLVLLTIVLGMVWVVYGVIKYEYYIPEIATIFFAMGLASGIIGVIFKLNNMNINDISISFREGAKDLVGAAIVVGMAQGIVLVLGDSSPVNNSVLNTLLHGMGTALSGLSSGLNAWFMYMFQSIFNFFVVSGSGQAAITMPLMAPLADIVGISKQVAVLAFQLGDGFTNLIVPTSGCLMAVLGVARLDWGKWAKFQIKFQGVLFVLSSLVMFVAVAIGFQ